jgi:hypothetical protein
MTNKERRRWARLASRTTNDNPFYTRVQFLRKRMFLVEWRKTFLRMRRLSFDRIEVEYHTPTKEEMMDGFFRCVIKLYPQYMYELSGVID